MNRSTISILAILSLSGSAFADDLFPAPWRFLPGTTVQHWDFTAGPAGGLGGAPDALPLNNIYGPPTLTASTGATWLPAAFGRNQVWDLSGGGGLSFFVPNTANPVNQKEVWLQVTYLANAAIPPPSLTVSSNFGLFTQIGGALNTPLTNGWTHQLTRWVTPICPPFERITISPSQVGAITLIDQVVIDTQCAIPTPGAAATLALGSLLALRRRR